MCRQVRCNTCGKATWAGCGAHAEQVLRGVPPSERCRCRAGNEASASQPTPPRAPWWRR